MIRVVVVAAATVARAGLTALVATDENVTVMGSASGWDTLTAQIRQLQPDVVLWEWTSSNDELVTVIAEAEIPPLVILADSPYNLWTEAVRSGTVQGILPRNVEELEIVAAVEAAATGLVVLHPEVIESMLSPNIMRESQQKNASQALTKREIEVLEMLASGVANKTIAKSLGISEHTVKFHVSSIFQKLEVSTRTEAVALGARLGLIML